MQSLVDSPEEKTFKEFCTLMERHIRPALNVIHERFLFNTRDKKEDESISEYVTLLRKMLVHCNFEEKVNKHICDCLVVGVKDEKIQDWLLGERMLTLKKAIETAVSIESARKYSRLMLGNKMNERHVEENEIDLEKLDLNTVAVRQIPPVLVELLIKQKRYPWK